MAIIHIAGNTYELIMENRNGWNVEAFRNRYSEVLERYDYIVGDWGYNQLRLKGFFRDGHQKATKDSTFSYITDYLNEYCNFGCAYFLLEKKNKDESINDGEEHIYLQEPEYTRTLPTIVTREKESKDSKQKDSKEMKEAKEAKDEKDGSDSKEVKTKSTLLDSFDDELSSLNTKEAANRSKRSVQREKGGEENGAEKSRSRNHQRSRSNQRQQAKAQVDDAIENELDNGSKKEGKLKRKDNFYRKGNRPQDKKNKGNRHQAEQLNSSNS